jgi:hypothetical protein
MTVTSSISLIVLVAASAVLMLGVLATSIVIGSMRRREGYQLSDEIEQAAGMQNRWRTRTRAEVDRQTQNGRHRAA